MHIKKLIVIGAASSLLMLPSCHQHKAANTGGATSTSETASISGQSEQECDSCSTQLLDFMRSNDTKIKADTYGNLSETAVFTDGIRDDLISLDKVNAIVAGSQKSNRIQRLKDKSYIFSHLGSIDISDDLECFVYSVTHVSGELESRNTYVLITESGRVTRNLTLTCDGKESGFVTDSRRESRNTFIISTFSVNMIDSDGNPKGGSDRVTVLDDGSITKVPL